MGEQEETDSSFSDCEASFLVLAFLVTASVLIIVNKWALLEFPFPGTLLALQFATSAGAVSIAGRLKWLSHDPLDWSKLLQFLPAATGFYVALYAASQLLISSNVDTLIVFRCAVPLAVAALEPPLLGSSWPCMQKWIALSVILGGAAAYVAAEHDFAMRVWQWAAFYMAIMAMDSLFVKYIVSNVNLSVWGLVLYNNLEALLIYPIQLVITGESLPVSISHLKGSRSIKVLLPVLLSCSLGLSMSFFGLACRKATSATTFAVMGVANKLVTVFLNTVIWHHHATPRGTVSLLFCIFGSILYQQATRGHTYTGGKEPPKNIIPSQQEVQIMKKEEMGEKC